MRRLVVYRIESAEHGVVGMGHVGSDFHAVVGVFQGASFEGRFNEREGRVGPWLFGCHARFEG